MILSVRSLLPLLPRGYPAAFLDDEINFDAGVVCTVIIDGDVLRHDLREDKSSVKAPLYSLKQLSPIRMSSGGLPTIAPIKPTSSVNSLKAEKSS